MSTVLSNPTDGAVHRHGAAIFQARCLIAIVQGAALCLLMNAHDKPRTWPATDSLIFTPLLLAAIFVPLIVILGLGQIRVRPLAIWAAVAAIAICGLGFHAANRGAVPASVWPDFALWLALAASMFIGQALVVDAIIEHRFMPSYTRHFDTAWKQAVQIALAFAFVGVFWSVLYLGATLFKLVDIGFFQRLIQRRWFWCPAIALAFAIALHVTDVQPSLIRGARTLVLTLFSWLLPLLVLILGGFLGSLPFISLAPLWKTGFATGLLLTAAGLLVLLINACYQDGAAEQTNSRIKRLAGSLGAIELVPVAGLAIWALHLRVAQYGWTTQRIFAASLVVLFAFYALGYAIAVIVSSTWLKRIEITNYASAYLALGIFIALFSPLADPARLMVASQVARLEAGTVRPDQFDFVALKFDGARWGIAVLTALKQLNGGPDAPAIRSRAAQALDMKKRVASNSANGATKTLEEKTALVAVYPAGRSLPSSLFDNSGGASMIPESCFNNSQTKCVARYVSLQQGDAEAIILDPEFGATLIFEQDASGKWQNTGTMAGPTTCSGFREALQSEDIDLQPHPRPDVLVGGERYTLLPPAQPCKAAPQ